jgi:UbiD family decarboxylase
MTAEFRDLREFMAVLSENGQLRTITGADPDLEIGAIVELNHEHDGPALLFDDIAGYPSGYRILCNAMDTMPRALLAIGLPADLDMETALVEYEKKMAGYHPLPPVQLSTGPIFENTVSGEDVDLGKFPTPKWHEGDGGRYIGTGCAVITRDPDTGEVHFGTYRVMIHDRNTAGLYIRGDKRGARIRNKYWERGQSCPVAVALGNEPMIFLGAATIIGRQTGAPKYDFVGYMRGAPVEVVEEEITGLPIPATAEIVMVGEVPPLEQEARPEGPFGEWTGYYASGTRAEAVIKVQTLYHRNDPILLGMPPLRVRLTNSHFGLPTQLTHMRERLVNAGIEDVLDVWPAAVPGVTVVQIRQRYPGHAMKAALAAVGEYMGRFVVVVDEDVDPRDPREVLWAMGTRADPATTITIVPGCQTSALDPRLTPEQRQKRDYTSSRAIILACKPFEWIKDFPPRSTASPELRKRTREKWQELF